LQGFFQNVWEEPATQLPRKCNIVPEMSPNRSQASQPVLHRRAAVRGVVPHTQLAYATSCVGVSDAETFGFPRASQANRAGLHYHTTER
jgi:hypothetical protein